MLTKHDSSLSMKKEHNESVARDKAKAVRRNTAMKGTLSHCSNYSNNDVEIVTISDLQFWKTLMTAEWKDMK